MKRTIQALTVLLLSGTIALVPGSEPVGPEAELSTSCTGFVNWTHKRWLWDDEYHQSRGGPHPRTWHPNWTWRWDGYVTADGTPHDNLDEDHTLDDPHHSSCNP